MNTNPNENGAKGSNQGQQAKEAADGKSPVGQESSADEICEDDASNSSETQNLKNDADKDASSPNNGSRIKLANGEIKVNDENAAAIHLRSSAPAAGASGPAKAATGGPGGAPMGVQANLVGGTGSGEGPQ